MIKGILQELTPPLIWRGGAKIKHIISRKFFSKWEFGAEQPPEFYDESFTNADNYHVHYTESRYYPLWTIIADRIKRGKIKRILDIGCGPGQMAALLYDKKIPQYLGLDFSSARIEQARKVCPEYDYKIVDIFNTDLLEKEDYDCVLVMEFLEHVESDLEVIERIKSDTRVIATVPNFAYTGHVRYFDSLKEVLERYQTYFKSLSVEEHIADINEKKYFLLDGIR